MLHIHDTYKYIKLHIQEAEAETPPTSCRNSDCHSSADDIALFSHFQKELQRRLDILQAFCSARGLKVNVQKTKTMVFEHQKSQTPPFTYAGNDIEQVEGFKYLGMFLKHSRTLNAAIDHLCKAATRAMFALQRRCQQLHLHDPGIQCNFFLTPW